MNRVVSGKMKKTPIGILIGNHKRLINPNERGVCFSEEILNNNERFKFCLLPTFELYKIVCFILNDEVWYSFIPISSSVVYPTVRPKNLNLENSSSKNVVLNPNVIFA